MVLFALGSLFMAGRSLQLGVWLDESERRLIVKSWFRNRSASVDEVSHVDSGQQPAIVLRTGDILSIPGLEHGLIFELRDPSTQWGPILHDLGRRIRNLQAESG